MKTVTAKLYEGMFLVDSARAASDFDGVNEAIRSLLEKAGAEIVSMQKWDERRLAYDISKTSRGTYILVFFRVDGTKVGQIERAVQLSEHVMRVLILNAEEMGQDYIEKETPAMVGERNAAEAAARAQAAKAKAEAKAEAEAEAKAKAEAEDKEQDTAESGPDESGPAESELVVAQESAEPDAESEEERKEPDGELQ